MKQLRTQTWIMCRSIMLILVLCATVIRPAVVATALVGGFYHCATIASSYNSLLWEFKFFGMRP
jgi:hypothetical protein